MPSNARDDLCSMLHIPQDRVRVVVGDVGAASA